MKNLSNPGTNNLVEPNSGTKRGRRGPSKPFPDSKSLATPRSNVQLAQFGTAWIGSEQFPHGRTEMPHPVH